MWMMPLHLHVNQKSDYDDDEKPVLIFFLELFIDLDKQNFERKIVNIFLLISFNICSGY